MLAISVDQVVDAWSTLRSAQRNGRHALTMNRAASRWLPIAPRATHEE